MSGPDRQAGNHRSIELRAPLDAYPHRRLDILSALASSSPSVDQLGMSLKLGLHKTQIVRGVELAIIDHRKEMAEKAIQSLEK